MMSISLLTLLLPQRKEKKLDEQKTRNYSHLFHEAPKHNLWEIAPIIKRTKLYKIQNYL